MSILKQVADILRDANLTINPKKSHFCMRRLRYLGYELNERGLSADPSKIAPVLNYPIPRTVRELRRFLGMAGWYRRFIRNFSEITAPLTDQFKGGAVKLKWSEACDRSFRLIKDALTLPPVLVLPDYTRPFTINCDASDIGVSAQLTQLKEEDGEHEVVIAFFRQN